MFVINGIDICHLKNQHWKEKNQMIPRLIWQVANNKVLPIEQLMRKQNDKLLDDLKYININGYTKTLLESVKKKVQSPNELNYFESLCVLSILIMMFKHWFNVENFEDYIILKLEWYKNENYYTNYPKLVDLSFNEWAVVYKNCVEKGNILYCLRTWLNIIKTEKMSMFPLNSSEEKFAEIGLIADYEDTGAGVPYSDKLTHIDDMHLDTTRSTETINITDTVNNTVINSDEFDLMKNSI